MDEQRDERRGRPREVIDPVRVNVQLSAAEYDRIYAIAKQHGLTVPAVVRAAISVLKNRQP